MSNLNKQTEIKQSDITSETAPKSVEKEWTGIGKKRVHNFKNLEGKRFERLLVLELTGISTKKKAVWKCQCDCGKIKYTTSRHLISGDVVSCGRNCSLNEVDLTGHKFGKLTVLGFNYQNGCNKYYWCKCECGLITSIIKSSLLDNRSKSCGCLRRKDMSSHKMSYTSVYKAWGSMIQRCSNPKNVGYPDYGGRGIKVCKRWHKFENFYRDMGDKPSKNYSLERINVNGNYNKKNCKWATNKEQGINKRNTIYIIFNKSRIKLYELAKQFNMNPELLYSRIFTYNWPIEKALNLPKKTKKYLEYKNESKTIKDWAQSYQINENCLRQRLKKGWDLERALTTPVKIKEYE